MAGAANPAMTQGGMSNQGGRSFLSAEQLAMLPTATPQGPMNNLQARIPQMPTVSPVANNPYQQAADAQKAAIQGTQASMGYRPMMVGSTGYQAQGYNAAMQGGPNNAASQMSNYTNPYENQVVQATLRDIEGNRQTAMNNVGAQATNANAFGGSRHALVEAETNKAYTQQALDTAAKMRSQGFNTALGAAQFDVGQQQAVNAANQMAANNAAQFGASAANTAASQAAQNAMTAQQLNQSAGLQGAQFGLNAAQQLAGLGGQSFGYGQAIQNQQMQQGTMQQQMMQALIDAAKAQYGGYTQAPMNKLNLPLAALGQAPVPETQTQTRQLGLFDYLTAGMKAYAGM